MVKAVFNGRDGKVLGFGIKVGDFGFWVLGIRVQG